MKRQLSLLLLTLMLFPVFIHSAIPPSERAALIALYNGTSGDGWTNKTGWKGNNNAPDGFSQVGSEGTWFGVRIINDHVLGVYLKVNNLVGTIPSHLQSLPYLTHLELDSNKLNGPIPLELMNLTQLLTLTLSSNQLTGTIPKELGTLPNLQRLKLDQNVFTGEIPVELSHISGLQQLTLSSNKLTGTLLPELGNLSNLEILDLHSNTITGEIPQEFCNLLKLKYLGLSFNKLIGPIHPGFGNLQYLYNLSLNNNQLTGIIPKELGKLSNLQSLSLGFNQLTGEIPVELGNLKNLLFLYIDRNRLTGPIPAELGNLTKLHTLWLCENQLTGNIPRELGNLPNLLQLILTMNKLTGPIPPELGNLSRMQYMCLGYNLLTGTIPPEMGKLTSLVSLSLYRNSLEGTIPNEFVNLVNLEDLFLYMNQLSGPIPEFLGALSKLKELYLGYNNFTGPIPMSLFSLPNITILELGRNKLSGTIPPELGNLVKLYSLDLSSNNFVGRIPDSITNLTNLSIYSFSLDHNGLYTDNESVKAFLTAKQYVWELSQTIAPKNITAAPVSSTAVNVSWMPILYTGDSGGYRVYYSTASGGPWIESGMTVDKTVSSFKVTGLTSDTLYFFMVRTQTNPGSYNLNTVISEPSVETTAKTLLQGGTYTLSVQSSPATGVGITLSPVDNSKKGNGNTNFTRTYNQGTTVTLTTPATFNGKNFSKWSIDGANNTNRTISVSMNANHTVSAIYAITSTAELKVQSYPKTGVGITVSPVDNSGNGNGATNFTRIFNMGTVVTLTAPATFNGKKFQKWSIDGNENLNRTISVTMNANHIVVAVYEFTAYTLQVQTTEGPGDVVSISPLDMNGSGTGTAPFTRIYASGTVVKLVAPAEFRNKKFAEWKVDGKTITAGTTVTVTMNTNHKAFAYYTMPSDPGLVVRPVNMTFTYKLKDPVPASQIMRVVLNGYTASWTVTSNVSWLKVTPSTGNTDGEVVVSITPTGLTAKTYKGIITVRAPGVPHSPQTVAVTLTVTK